MLVCSISDGLSVACDLQVIDHHSRSKLVRRRMGSISWLWRREDKKDQNMF